MGTELIRNIDQFLSSVKPVTAELVSIVAQQDFVKLAFYEKQMTLEKAIGGTTLKKLEKTINEENLTILIVFLINRLSSNFNVGRKFTGDQAVMMAIDLIENFGYETLEDILLMFRMVRTGRIGDGKDFKLDSQTVFHKWIPQYLELKIDLRQKLHNREKEMSFENSLTIEDVKKAYAKSKSTPQQKEDEINAEIDKITEGFNREDLENLILIWEKDISKKHIMRHLTKKRLTILK